MCSEARINLNPLGSSNEVLRRCKSSFPLLRIPSKVYSENDQPAIPRAISVVPGSIPPPCGAMTAQAVLRSFTCKRKERPFFSTAFNSAKFLYQLLIWLPQMIGSSSVQSQLKYE